MTSVSELRSYTYYRGRVALYVLLKALGIDQGDEVITQAFTCVAVPEGIMAAGAKPVFVDIETSGFNMDTADLERKITFKTRAIIVQHTYGIPADMDSIVQVAERHRVRIIEDCCHTLASTFKGKTVGTFGVASFYSFEWGKPIVVGIGGSALINDVALYEKLESQYVHFRYPPLVKIIRIQLQYAGFKFIYRPSLYWPVRGLFHLLGKIGAAESNYNSVKQDEIARDFHLRMPKSLQKRLVHELIDLDAQVRHSRWVTAEYESRIKSSAISHPVLPKNTETVFARYPLVVDDKYILLKEARKANIELADWYLTPVHPLDMTDCEIVNYKAGSCPVAEERCNQVVTLPTHIAVKKRDIDRSVRFLNRG